MDELNTYWARKDGIMQAIPNVIGETTAELEGEGLTQTALFVALRAEGFEIYKIQGRLISSPGSPR